LAVTKKTFRFEKKLNIMAKIKFGMMMTDARGKLGGQVFSKNKGGAYIRTKVTPVNPATVAQQLVRAIFAFFSQNWRALTEAQRTAWNAAVSNFTSTDIFADVRTPSGFNLYKKLNQNLLLISAAPIATPPLPQTVISPFLDSIVADQQAGKYLSKNDYEFLTDLSKRSNNEQVSYKLFEISQKRRKPIY